MPDLWTKVLPAAAWLLVTLGAAAIGFLVASLFAAGAYERGKRDGFKEGHARGRWNGRADAEVERYAANMGGIHHPLGHPVRYETLNSLLWPNPEKQT